MQTSSASATGVSPWVSTSRSQPGVQRCRSIGSVTKRLLSSTASKAHGSASCSGMDGALGALASPRGGQGPLSSLRVLHAEVLWTGRHSTLCVTLPGQELADTVYWAETPQQSATCSQALQSVSKKWEREETCGMSPLSPVTWRTHP